MCTRFFLLVLLLPFCANARTTEPDSTFKQILSNDCIVNSQQIKIPGYPNAYNPSLIPYKNGYLLSFRYISRYPEALKNGFRDDVSFIGVARLDKNFKVSEKSVQLLNIVSYSTKISLTAEDGRLLTAGEKIYLFFNDLPPFQARAGSSMYLGELIEERGLFVLKEPAKVLNYPQAIPIEKNWTPFVSGNQLYLIYSDQPRVILEVDVNTGYCHEVERTVSDGLWKWGQIRGGTPAYLIDEMYLTFFHSSFPAQTSKGRAYVMGAYLFEKEPPFAIRAISSSALGNLTDYTQDNSPKVVFPGGLAVQGDSIFVAWGKGDKQIHITTFDKKKLLTSIIHK